MKEWDDIVEDKLKSYTYDEDVSDAEVASFFEEMDDEDGKAKAATKARFGWRIAASVVVLLAAGASLWVLSAQSFDTGLGEREVITLPDGSKVHLNANSELSYSRMQWLFEREVSLEGEAFFEVEKGSTFSVVSAHGTTSVLGTSFNIFARNNAYQVQCFTGRVQVASEEKVITLTPGEGVKLTFDQALRSFDFDAGRKNWVAGEFYFEDEPLARVFEEFTYQFSLKVDMSDSIRALRYTGYFPQGDSDLALKLICEPMDLTYEVSERTVKLEPRR